jgi:hypothetical protein
MGEAPMAVGRGSATGDILSGSCMDCGVNTIARDEYYMLKDAVWRTINPLVLGMLCLKCAEDRLGRPLCRADFSSAPVNQRFAHSCAALAVRLRRRRRSGGVSPPSRNRLTAKALQSRLAKKRPTQNAMGRLSAALLPYRGPDGQVPRATLRRILSEVSPNAGSTTLIRAPHHKWLKRE